ncbi:hypothetical protein BDZ45DRAFT_670727 [Acephala macrosclerotiorum]|nr:hypothetical protein BDZ45DRAFT_670727 [Acephala macrosclerotiorum]
MIVKSVHLRPIPSFLLPFTQSTAATQTRCLHQRVRAKAIPSPTPFVPNTQTFLTLIGRNLSQHASKIPSWRALFSLSSEQLKELGIDPPRSRRYLLRWREKFRNRQFGIGGDFKFVKDGVAELRVAEIPVSGHSAATATLSPGKRKVVVNVAAGGSASGNMLEKFVPVKGIKIKGAHTIVGPHVQPVKGGNGARIVIKEGLWEERRGHKIDGGERRQAEVRAKKRGEEKRAR